jgi:heme/copper-type cytochrome/quinol oxidase subunit 2
MLGLLGSPAASEAAGCVRPHDIYHAAQQQQRYHQSSSSIVIIVINIIIVVVFITITIICTISNINMPLSLLKPMKGQIVAKPEPVGNLERRVDDKEGAD